jgi:CO dehydrogenase/acetyl-CoA synthase epsilon subunit
MDDFLRDPQFQEALQKIRTEFDIPYPATPEDKKSWYTKTLAM